MVLEQFRTDTADHADYILPATTQLEHWDVHLAYGHTDVLLNRPAIAPLRRRRCRTPKSFAGSRMRWDSPSRVLPTTTRRCAALPTATAVDFEELLAHGFARLDLPQAPFAGGAFTTPSGKCEFLSDRLAALGQDGLPDHLPNHEPAGSSARHPLAMISPPARNFLNSTFVNIEPPAGHRRRAAARTASGRCAGARHRRRQRRARVQRPRQPPLQGARDGSRARPGVVHGLGVWWRKFGRDGTNVNELTSQRLTDLGRAPTFYDCLVQVERDAAAA